VFSINVTTGAIIWKLNLGTSGYQTPYGVWPISNFQAIADGMLYFSGGHLYSPPIYAGALLYCVNATSGALIWSMPQFNIANNGLGAISDGYMVIPNAYDNQIYCYGMGPTKTTVSAPQVGVSTSTPVTITGTVTDISAGSQQNAVAMNFPNGLPCVSDASQSAWMEYVYEQQPMPTNVTGVPVTLSVIDSNGNNRPIGTTTTDASGLYSYTWTPDIPGNYTLTATFAGTQSYYGSSAQTAFYASSPPATPAPTATPITGLATASEVTYGIVAAVIAIIIAIAIVGLLLLRKKP
jgi:hypothetical protein